MKQKNGRTVQWAIYKGEREKHSETFGSQTGKVTISDAKHLDIVVNPRNETKDLLTISITCLYKDLLTVIDRFYLLIEENKNGELEKWRQTANAILEPQIFHSK